MAANQALVRSVPMAHKQGIRHHLGPLGFRGYSLAELTPTKTRRAQVMVLLCHHVRSRLRLFVDAVTHFRYWQCANWVLYYREALFGVPLHELLRRKDVEAENLSIRLEGKHAREVRGSSGSKDLK